MTVTRDLLKQSLFSADFKLHQVTLIGFLDMTLEEVQRSSTTHTDGELCRRRTLTVDVLG